MCYCDLIQCPIYFLKQHSLELDIVCILSKLRLPQRPALTEAEATSGQPESGQRTYCLLPCFTVAPMPYFLPGNLHLEAEKWVETLKIFCSLIQTEEQKAFWVPSKDTDGVSFPAPCCSVQGPQQVTFYIKEKFFKSSSWLLHMPYVNGADKQVGQIHHHKLL